MEIDCQEVSREIGINMNIGRARLYGIHSSVYKTEKKVTEDKYYGCYAADPLKKLSVIRPLGRVDIIDITGWCKTIDNEIIRQ